MKLNRCVSSHAIHAGLCLLASTILAEQPPSPVRQAVEANELSVNVLEEITLGGVKQWILMRGDDETNPVLLFLHGGPGFPEMPFTHIDSQELEKHFVVVNWDQRGAGKSFAACEPEEDMNIEQFLSDTHDLLELLKVRFSQQKIFLVGHSWGSVLGLETAHRHPELLHAYVGMGQVVDMRRGEELSYRYTLAKAHEAGNTGAVKMLENLGPPPYEGGFQSLSTQRMLLAQFGGTFRRISYPQLLGYSQTSPHYSEGDLATWMRSFTNTQEIMWKNIGGIGFANRIREIKVPVFFFCGRYDQQTPSELVNDYYKSLKASLKRIVWFEESGHMPNIEEPDKYQNVLIETVLVETLRFESEKK